jgi:hypothetical protein
VPEIPSWYLRGDWFDVCKCTIPCPEPGQVATWGQATLDRADGFGFKRSGPDN